jgi:four helix bundle protein
VGIVVGNRVRDYRKLQAWEKAHQLALTIYRHTRRFPREEQYGLVAQMRRAAASVPANLAEGCGRGGQTELARFMVIAQGSTMELDYHVLLSADLGYLNSEDASDLSARIDEVNRMLTTYIARLRCDPPATPQDGDDKREQTSAL